MGHADLLEAPGLYDDDGLVRAVGTGDLDVERIDPAVYDYRPLTRGEPEWERRWAVFLWLQVNGFRPEDALRRWDRRLADSDEPRNARDRGDSPSDQLAPGCAISPCDQLGDGARAQLVTLEEETEEEEPGGNEDLLHPPCGIRCDQWELVELINERKRAVARYRRVLAARMLSPFVPLTSSALAASLGCSRSSAQRVLRDLVEQGAARSVGARRYRRYYGTRGGL